MGMGEQPFSFKVEHKFDRDNCQAQLQKAMPNLPIVSGLVA